MFISLKNFPHLRRSLPSLNSARSHLYSSSFFGDTKWYSEGFDFGAKALTTTERRKFRFGMKSNVDFLVQLDMQNLKRMLVENDAKIEKFTERLSTVSQLPRFSDSSLLGLSNQVDPNRCKNICTILDRVISNLHFSQTMNEYFALDEMVEPAKQVLIEAVKQGPNLGTLLRGGSFASHAQIFRHLASSFDSDSACNAERRSQNRRRATPSSRRRSARRASNNRYPLGFCWNFQDGRCDSGSSCSFKHSCTKCDSPNHGFLVCPDRTARSNAANN